MQVPDESLRRGPRARACGPCTLFRPGDICVFKAFMELASNIPIRCSSLQWQLRHDLWAMTVICKATFRLVPGRVELSEEQDDINEQDNFWNDDRARSLYAPSDLVPYKMRSDVMLVGHAFAPRGEPKRSILARLTVSSIDKSIEVFGDRSWGPDGILREGAPFVRFPLRYERAGISESLNPVGMRPDAVDAYGAVAVPNLQPPSTHVQRGERVPAIGFGPLSPAWPGRAEKVPSYASSWAYNPRYDQPLPEGLNPRFFNAAPEDQQVAALRADERIALENLHPEHPRLITSLPGLTPRATIERGGAAGPEDLNLTCDTLWIDSDRSICTVVWRSHFILSHAAQRGRITINWSSGAVSPQSMPQRGSEAGQVLETLVGHRDRIGQAAVLPFQPRAESQPPPVRPSPSSPGFAPVAPPAYVPSAPPVPPAPPAPLVPLVPAAAQPPVSPWAVGGAASFGQPPPLANPMSGMLPTAVLPAPSDARESSRAASSATAPTGRSSPIGEAAHEALTLLWLDAERAPALVDDARWRRLLFDAPLADVPVAPPDEEDEEDIPEEDVDADADLPAEVRQRRWVSKILSRGETTDERGLAEAIMNATTEDGTLEPPIALVGGELSFPYDAWETVKALIVSGTPAAATDKKLKELFDSVQEIARTPGIEGNVSVAEGLIARLREAFAQSNGKISAAIESQAERMMLEGRRYQKRVLFGQTFLRGLLHIPGAEGGIPTYLPEALSKELPLVQRMQARLLAEVHVQQDQYETHELSLRALALGRRVRLGIAAR